MPLKKACQNHAPLIFLHTQSVTTKYRLEYNYHYNVIIIKGAKTIVQHSVKLHITYFDKQVHVLQLSKLQFHFAIIFICHDLAPP